MDEDEVEFSAEVSEAQLNFILQIFSSESSQEFIGFANTTPGLASFDLGNQTLLMDNMKTESQDTLDNSGSSNSIGEELVNTSIETSTDGYTTESKDDILITTTFTEDGIIENQDKSTEVGIIENQDTSTEDGIIEDEDISMAEVNSSSEKNSKVETEEIENNIDIGDGSNTVISGEDNICSSEKLREEFTGLDVISGVYVKEELKSPTKMSIDENLISKCLMSPMRAKLWETDIDFSEILMNVGDVEQTNLFLEQNECEKIREAILDDQLQFAPVNKKRRTLPDTAIDNVMMVEPLQKTSPVSSTKPGKEISSKKKSPKKPDRVKRINSVKKALGNPDTDTDSTKKSLKKIEKTGPTKNILASMLPTEKY